MLHIIVTSMCTVPVPQVDVFISSDTTYIGSNATICCTATLSDAVDSGVEIFAAWSGPSGDVTSSSRIAVTNLTKLNDSELYHSVVIISQLESIDNGNYTCTVTVNSASSYINGNMEAATVALIVGGEQLPLFIVFRDRSYSSTIIEMQAVT